MRDPIPLPDAGKTVVRQKVMYFVHDIAATLAGAQSCFATQGLERESSCKLDMGVSKKYGCQDYGNNVETTIVLKV